MSGQEDPGKVGDNTRDRVGEAASDPEAPTKFSLERERTDESLRQEREKTDQAVEARQENMARHADAVVERARDAADAVLSVARDNADAVLDAAREKADERQAPNSGAGVDEAVLGAERNVADRALQAERDSADEVLREERDEYAHTFLPMERESTDRYLRSERIRSDDAVMNRDDFLAIVTHDLRDLLGGIVLTSTVLAKRAEQKEDVSTLAETRRIARYAARMGRLISDLMDIASIDAGKLAVTPTPGNLAALIAEAVDAFQAAAASRGIALESRIDGASLAASFDHDRILQVLGNLISNSLKHTPQGGTITLGGERDGDGVRLTVDDTGSGIPDDALASVFERFYQVTAGERGGLGLGLYISRCLIDAHRGSIRAESKPGPGTRMCLWLPCEQCSQ